MTMFCRPGAQRAVIGTLEDLGAERIPCSIDTDGLKVEEKRQATRGSHAAADNFGAYDLVH